MPQRTTVDLQQLIADLQSQRAALDAQRRTLDAQIAALERAMSALLGAAPRPARRATVPPPRTVKAAASAPGAHRRGSLKEYAAKALAAAGRVMSVKEITAAVVRGGYKTKNKTLAKSVGIALTEMPEVRKVRRGKFRLK